jgi:hypothetical protein
MIETPTPISDRLDKWLSTAEPDNVQELTEMFGEDVAKAIIDYQYAKAQSNPNKILRKQRILKKALEDAGKTWDEINPYLTHGQ